MLMFRKASSFIVFIALCVLMLPIGSFAYTSKNMSFGNSDLNILNGGTMLNDGEDFYFVQDGIFVKSGEDIFPLSGDIGKNLNLYDGHIYYTVGAEVRKIPKTGGEAELYYINENTIEQMYIVDGALRFISEGIAYELSKDAKSLQKLSELNGIKGLIPTQYGNIFLTGELFNYTVWANGQNVLSGVNSCYTDSGYFTVQKQNRNYMVEIEKLFNGFYEPTDLKDYNIHGTVSLMELFEGIDENTISEYNDNNDLQCDFNALLIEAGITPNNVRLMEEKAVLSNITPPLSDGQKNIVKRARQLTEIKWTPLEDIPQWGNAGVFKAETTYTGLPYGQPVNTNGYVGYGISLEGFATAVLDNTSKFYTTYSYYNKIAPSLSTDCSGYVSYAWDLKNRRTTFSLPDVAERVGDQSIYSLQVGDCLNKASSHVVLVSGLTYDSNGTIIGVDIMEQTPVITRVTRYGAGQTRSLNSLQSYYLNGGYVIIRNPNRDSVTYTPNPAVPLDGEYIASMKEPAPKSQTTSFIGGKNVALTSDNAGATIYYTLDGSNPTTSSTTYTGPIKVYNTTKLRAISVSGNFSGSTILEYTIKVPQVATPTATVSSGLSSGNTVSSGTQIRLTSTSGATIYYTTDGTEPSTSSMVYSSPITVNQNTTIKAMAEANGMSRSQTAVFTYNIGSIYTITASAGNGGSISPSGSANVLASGSRTYSITPLNGYVISDVIVNGVSIGAVSSYSFNNINSNQTISVSFKSTAQIPFTDTKPESWYYEAVKFAHSNKLFNGTSETAFSPDMMMTRGMFVTVLGRTAGVPDNLTSGTGLVTGSNVNIRSGPSIETNVVGKVTDRNTPVQVFSRSGDWYNVRHGTVNGFIRNDLIKVYNGNFTDLKSGSYYNPYVEWAYLSGIANGISSNQFGPDNNITREQMCMLLYNYANIYGKTLPQVNPNTAFSDDAVISSQAKTAVYALRQAGIINGMGDGSFAPKGLATRAQVAQIFMNFVNAVK